MADPAKHGDATPTMSFEAFWEWLQSHADCILRAATPEAVIYDDDDLHWAFASEEPGILVVQLLRGKRPVGELFIEPEQLGYVQGMPGQEEGEFHFELIQETESDRVALFTFVLAHGYDDDAQVHGRVVH